MGVAAQGTVGDNAGRQATARDGGKRHRARGEDGVARRIIFCGGGIWSISITIRPAWRLAGRSPSTGVWGLAALPSPPFPSNSDPQGGDQPPRGLSWVARARGEMFRQWPGGKPKGRGQPRLVGEARCELRGAGLHCWKDTDTTHGSASLGQGQCPGGRVLLHEAAAATTITRPQRARHRPFAARGSLNDDGVGEAQKRWATCCPMYLS